MSYEFLFRDVKSTFPFPLSEGISLELNSVVNQQFQVTHGFKFGSQTNPSTYNFGVLLQSGKYLFHGQIDNDGSLSSKCHYTWKDSAAGSNPFVFSPSIKTKIETQLTSQQSAVVLEQEFIGNDYALTFRAINPNPISAPPSYKKLSTESTTTGVFSISYMQHLLKGLSLGGEFNYSRPSPEIREPSMSLAARYIPEITTPLPQPLAFSQSNIPSPFPPVSDSDPQQIYTAMYTPANGLVHASYWRRLNQRMELATEFQGLVTGRKAGGRREGIATVGFRCQTVFANIKSQIDSTGRILSTLEYVLAPGLQFSLGAEMEYGKVSGGQGKVAIGFSMEA